MSNKFTDTAVNAFLAQYSTLWLSLHYDDPGLGTYNNYEVVGGSYTRKSSTFSSPTSRTIWIDNALTFNGLPATALTHVGFWTELSGGILAAVAQITDGPITITSGGSYSVPQHGVSLSIA